MTTLVELAERNRHLFAFTQAGGACPGAGLSDDAGAAICDAEADLIAAIAATPATSLRELRAKAEVAAREYRPEDGDAPCIEALMRSLVADTIRLCSEQ